MKYKSLGEVWRSSCNNYGNLTAFCDKDLKLKITYEKAYKLLCFLTEKFRTLGIKEDENISLFAVNSPYWLIIEQAIINLGAVCVSKTSNTSFSELEYIYKNSQSKALIADSKDVIDFLLRDNILNNAKFIIYTGNDTLNSTENIVYFNDLIKDFDINAPVKEVSDIGDKTAYINYTSGTSSNPKGAMLPNNGMSYIVEQLQKYCEIKSGATFVVTFPLSSAGGKSFNLLCFSKGARLVYTQYKDFWDVIDKIQPDYLHCAPKILQTMYQKFTSFAQSQGIFFNLAYKTALKLSQMMLKCEQKKQNSCIIRSKIRNVLDKLVFKKVRNSLLKDDVILFVGSAHLAPVLEDYFKILNIKLIQHYGLTETTGLAVSNDYESQKKYPYTVGTAFEGTKIEIVNPETKELLPAGQIGLITLIGPEILSGYYNNSEATKKALIRPYCLNTGDLGYLNEDGYLTVLTRCDDVIVLSNGYNIFAPLLENEAKDSEFINQIIITGHGKPYLSALIVLDKSKYDFWCKNNSSPVLNPNNNSEFCEFIVGHLNEKIKRKSDFKYYEKIKKVYFINEDFTVENGLLTNTLKVKRNKISKMYNKEIENLYKG